MARTLEFQPAVRANFRLGCLHHKRQLCPRENAVQLRQDRVVDCQMLPMPGDLAGQFRQDALNFLALFDKQLPQRVVAVDRLHRLDENVLPEDDTS